MLTTLGTNRDRQQLKIIGTILLLCKVQGCFFWGGGGGGGLHSRDQPLSTSAFWGTQPTVHGYSMDKYNWVCAYETFTNL